MTIDGRREGNPAHLNGCDVAAAISFTEESFDVCGLGDSAWSEPSICRAARKNKES